jgi:hypothetical protein
VRKRRGAFLYCLSPIPMATFMLIVPTSMDIALFGAQQFYTDGVHCYASGANGRRGKRIPRPSWYSLPLDALIDS